MTVGRAMVGCFGTAMVLMLLAAPPLLAQPRSFTDSAGRQVQVPLAINRIMVAGPPASVLVYSLAPEKLVGWVQAFEPDQRAFLAEPYRSLPRHGRITARDGAPDAAAIRALKPDLILDSGDIGPRYVTLADRTQAATGIPYVLLDGSLANTAATYRRLGELIGMTTRAEQLARAAECILRDVQARAAATPRDRLPRLFYAQGPDGLDTHHSGAINQEILDLVGADAGHHGAAPTMRQVQAWNPDVVVTLDSDFQRGVFTMDAWRDIEAVRNGRVLLSPRAPFGWLDSPPSANRLMGLIWLADALYPATAGRDLRAATRNFYAEFYHLQLTDSQLDRLLPPPPGPPIGDRP